MQNVTGEDGDQSVTLLRQEITDPDAYADLVIMVFIPVQPAQLCKRSPVFIQLVVRSNIGLPVGSFPVRRPEVTGINGKFGVQL